MLRLHFIAAAGLALIAAPAVAKEKTEQPKAKKVCRTVQMSGRITPQRICRKVERPAPEERDQRNGRATAEADGQQG